MRAKAAKYDVMVIGMGCAGLAAALFAVRRGFTVAICGASGGLDHSSGLIDLMAVHPVEQSRVWNDPWQAIAALVKDRPQHPYAKLREAEIRTAVEEFCSLLEKQGLPYRSRGQYNSPVPTPAGTIKQSFLLPQSVWPGTEALLEKAPTLVVGFLGLKGFSPRQMVESLQGHWSNLRHTRVKFPGKSGELHPEHLALALNDPAVLRNLAESLRGEASKGADYLGFPAVLGLERPGDIILSLEKLTGKRIFEIPTLPPSLAGRRLRTAIGQGLSGLGVALFNRQLVFRAENLGGEGWRLYLGRESATQTIQARNVILASGRFLSHGLKADRRRIIEPVFGLPVCQPPTRGDWMREQFFRPGGHPLSRAGIQVDRDFSPLDKSGRPVPGLSAAGNHPGPPGLGAGKVRRGHGHRHGLQVRVVPASPGRGSGGMSFLQAGSYVALVLCLAGLLWQMKSRPWPQEASDASGSGSRLTRLRRMSGRISAFAGDVLLLSRTVRKSPYRWLAHGLILSGFTYLLLFHALGDFFAARLVDNYQATNAPWRFLRNLAGVMVILGLAMALLRRLKNKRLRELSRFQDWFLLAVLAGIMLSGFMLESAKIISPAVFQRMADQYLAAGLPRENEELKAYWAKEHGVVFPKPPAREPQTVRAGAELAANNCLYCHGRTGNAFVSLRLANSLGPLAKKLNDIGAHRFFYHLHVLLCLLALACLPWGKFLHPLATPIRLLKSHGENHGDEAAGPARIWPALEACTSCGECSLHCSVAPAFDVLGVAEILPSIKLVSWQRRRNGLLTVGGLRRLIQGNRICTDCHRCTDNCPAGIDLYAMWQGLKSEFHTPAQQIRDLGTINRAHEMAAPKPMAAEFGPALALKRATFRNCLQCTTCTSVCPVAALSPSLTKHLNSSPQQVMNLLRMGLVQQAFSSGMIWSCTTCYQCSEHCPQDIPVADVMRELRNMALGHSAGCANERCQ